MDGLTPQQIKAIKEDILSSLHCAMPGIVESCNAEIHTADIRPAVRTRQGTELPLLQDVPVFLPSTTEGTAPWTVSPGDGCLVIFSDLPIDSWLAGDDAAPVPDRKHDLSDAFAFIGFHPRTNNQNEEGGDTP